MTVGRAVDWILFVILLHFCCSSQGLVSDGEILLEFKSNVIDRLYMLGSWGAAGTDPCDDNFATGGFSRWKGVRCNNVSGSGLEVISLELPSLSLASADVTMLAKLKNLDRLDLSDNSFSGRPPDLNELQKLWFLYLGNNQFEGPLVADRFPLDLVEIQVQNNHFTGEIGTTNLFFLSLKYLDLHGNKFTGELPDMTYPGLEPLGHLDVSGNQFTGPLPSALMQLELEYCNMSGNGFSGKFELDQTKDWFTARVLDLSKNRLSGSIPARLFTSFDMTYLDLSDNQLEGPIPSKISDEMRTQILYLYLQNNRLTGDFFNLLRANFSSLVELRLHGNGGFNLSREIQRSRVREGSFSWFSDTALYLSGRCSSQVELSDFFNHTETLPPSAVNRTLSLPRLRVLELSDCELEGSIPSDIFNPQMLPSLKVLDLSGNSLNGRVPAGLRQMPWLRELRLGRNLLDGHIDNWVDSNWTNLEVLDISDNCVWFNTSKSIEDMLKFPRVKELRLGSNSVVSGILLPRVTNQEDPMEHLEVLDLSRLQLNGDFSFLYTPRNLFPSLKYLDLSGNSITGPVPEGVVNFAPLTYFNLSYNSLSGEIPLLPPSLFNREYFIGNVRLCGPPLDNCRVPTKGLASWKILLIVAISVLLSSVSCLVLGWIWRKRTDAKKQKQDAELIAALLDRDTTTLMPLRELRKATDDFSDENQIGVGGFGVVYRGVLEDGTVVAIKKSKRDGSTSEDKCQFLNEVKILSQVHHRNLVRLLGCCLANKNALLVFEFVANGTLEEHLHSKHGLSPLSWDQRLIIAIQTASALDYLHTSANPPIYHLDVKSANILLDNNLNAKVADFGISKLAPAPDATHITTLHGFQGTFGYMDPEMVVRSSLTGKSDVYAFGVVLLELITAKAVVDRSRGEDVSLVKWAGRMIQAGNLEEVIDPVILDTFCTSDGRESIDAVAQLAMECLLFRSEDRPTMKGATRDLLCIQQSRRPPSSNWTATTRNEDIMIELSSVKGFTM